MATERVYEILMCRKIRVRVKARNLPEAMTEARKQNPEYPDIEEAVLIDG
jgi:hypothetical protein